MRLFKNLRFVHNNNYLRYVEYLCRSVKQKMLGEYSHPQLCDLITKVIGKHKTKSQDPEQIHVADGHGIGTFVEFYKQSLTLDDDLRIFKWLVSIECPHDARVVNSAIQQGNFRLVKYLIEREKFEYDHTSCTTAAKFGNLEILRWLREVMNCKWIKETSKWAAMSGNIEILRYVLVNGCEYSTDLLNSAIAGESVDCVKFVCELKDRTAFTPSQCDCKVAASLGNLPLLKCLRSFMADSLIDMIPMQAATIGSLDILKYCLETEGKIPQKYVAQCAISEGHVEILAWLRDVFNFKFDSLSYNIAAIYGRVGVLQWLLDNNYPSGGELEYHGSRSFICTNAVRERKFESLKWLHDNGFPWNEDTFCAAIAIGNLEIVKYLCQNKCPWNARVFSDAQEKGDHKILECLVEYRGF